MQAYRKGGRGKGVRGGGAKKAVVVVVIFKMGRRPDFFEFIVCQSPFL
jgi:hypothetical protein